MNRVVLLMLFLFLPLFIFCQIEVEEVGVLTDEFEKATDFFKNYKFEKCYQTISPVVEKFISEEKSGRLQREDEELFKRSLELRGVSLYLMGRENLAKDDFTKLITIDPNHSLEITSSTKVMVFYNSIRNNLCGILNLIVNLPDATLLIDSKAFDVKQPIYLLEGLHILKVEALGYDSFTKEINIVAGQTISESIKLKPNSRKIYFFIKPKGAKLYIGDKFLGSAEVNASANQEWMNYLTSYNLNYKDYYVVESLYLPEGKHKIKISAPCYEEKEFLLPVSLDYEHNKPGYIKPISLSKETAILNLGSYPSGAKVEIDGTYYGITPLEIKDFCSGEHTLRIYKENQGEYREKIVIKGKQVFTLKVRLRPTLLYAGLTSDQETLKDVFLNFGNILKNEITKISSFNVKISEEANPLLPDFFYSKGVNDSERKDLIKSLCSKYLADGIVVGKVYVEGDKKMVSLRLFVPSIEGFDETKFLLVDTKDASNIIKAFDKKVALDKFNISVVQVKDRVVVLSSPNNSKIKSGDRILKINGKEVADEKNFVEELNSDKESVLLTILRGPETQEIELKRGKSVRLYLAKDEGLRRRFLLDKQNLISAENDEERIIASINLAVSYIYLERFEEALKILKGIDVSDNNVLSPTINYLMAICQFNLNMFEEAKDLLSKIDVTKENRFLGTSCEVLISPLKEDLLKMLNERR